MNEYAEIKELLRENEFDCVDFGCSTGGSIEFAKRVLGAKNVLGIDINIEKINKTRERGYSAVQADLTAFPEMNEKVKFSILSHFLEHLPSVKMAANCIRSAINISEDFIYIQQPYFDADSYLFQQGYKLFWSDWHGHPNRMTQLEFHNILSRFQDKGLIHRFIMYGHDRIKNSRNPAIHQLTSPEDQHVWTVNVHPPKPKFSKRFNFRVYHEIKVLIGVDNADSIEKMQDNIGWDDVLFDSRA